ncbi:hypothetical protein KY310_02665 [Candidatus Woesearchaeota archaeon]|nr:hypothetical protein [Candidatus Woesearchaeota archaeon]
MTINKVLPDSNLAKYVGEWVIVCNNRIVAHNKDLQKIKKEIKKCKTTPTVAKIPKKETLIF